MIDHTSGLTGQRLDVSLCIRSTSTQLSQDHLLFSDRGLPTRKLRCGFQLSIVKARTNHTQEQVGSIILNSTTENLLVNGDSRGTLNIAESMNRSTDAEITDALDIRSDAFVLTSSLLAVLDGDLGKANANSADVAAEDVAPIESLACPHRIVKPFKVDYIKSVNQC